MYHLIKKDLLIQKRTFWISMLMVLFFTIALANLGPAGLAMSIFAINYTLTLGAIAQEDRTNGDMLLQSLPIKKSTIVSSKYVSVYVFAAYAILLNLAFIGLIRLLHLPIPVIPFSLEGVFWALLSITLYTSVSFPLIFKWGYLRARTVNYILTFTFIFIATNLMNHLVEGTPLNIQTDPMLKVSLWLCLGLLLVLSYFLSLTFYKRREF